MKTQCTAYIWMCPLMICSSMLIKLRRIFFSMHYQPELYIAWVHSVSVGENSDGRPRNFDKGLSSWSKRLCVFELFTGFPYDFEHKPPPPPPNHERVQFNIICYFVFFTVLTIVISLVVQLHSSPLRRSYCDPCLGCFTQNLLNTRHNLGINKDVIAHEMENLYTALTRAAAVEVCIYTYCIHPLQTCACQQPVDVDCVFLYYFLVWFRRIVTVQLSWILLLCCRGLRELTKRCVNSYWRQFLWLLFCNRLYDRLYGTDLLRFTNSVPFVYLIFASRKTDQTIFGKSSHSAYILCRATFVL